VFLFRGLWVSLVVLDVCLRFCVLIYCLLCAWCLNFVVVFGFGILIAVDLVAVGCILCVVCCYGGCGVLCL